MIRFLLKKNFIDGWDNMFILILENLITIALLVGGYFAVSSLISTVYIAIPVFVVFVCLFSISLFAIAETSQLIACFKTVSIKDFFLNISKVLKIGIQFGITLSVLFFLAIVAFPFYSQNESIIGRALLFLLIWLYILLVLALQWFPSLYVNMHGNYIKTLKKCFLFFFDNPGFSIFCFIYEIVIFFLSVILVFLIPSFSGVVLAQCNSVKLRMYKYDWMEENAEEIQKFGRKVHIPWTELIAEDKEQIGNRNFLDLLFPWR